MSDARRRAEEALAAYDVCYTTMREQPSWTPCLGDNCAEALRALLAEGPEAAVLPLEAPECNDGDDCCRYCGRGLQPCGACKAPPPADAVAEDVEPRHELKTWPEPFAAVLDGRKRFEIRKADRPYTDGDVLLLREWDPKAEEFNGAYTGRSIKVKVTYRVRPGMWGLSADTCVLGIVPLASPANAATEAEEIVCPETLSAERRCGACPTCRCIAEAERLRAAIRAHEAEFERLTLRPDPCDYDLWTALAARRGDV